MKDNFKFSIGIPAYKSNYLYECISSILNQTYSNFELIILNDFSPNPIDEILSQFNDERISYFKNEKNEGSEKVTNNFNKCLEKSHGDFFILMGDDDKMDLDYLREFSNLILKYPSADVFHCRSKIIDKNSKVLMFTPSWPEYESVYDNIWHRMNENRIQFLGDFVFRTKKLKEKGGFVYLPLAWGTDDLTVYTLIGTNGIAHVNKSLLSYRRHSNNISSIGNHELKLKAILIMQDWFHNFLKSNPISEDDLVIHQYLNENIDRLIQKQKVYIMSSSLRLHFFPNLLSWINKRKKYKISILEISYSVFIYFKEKKLKI